MLLCVKVIDGWYYVIVCGRQDKLGYSTEDAAKRRLETILDGWL